MKTQQAIVLQRSRSSYIGAVIMLIIIGAAFLGWVLLVPILADVQLIWTKYIFWTVFSGSGFAYMLVYTLRSRTTLTLEGTVLTQYRSRKILQQIDLNKITKIKAASAEDLQKDKGGDRSLAQIIRLKSDSGEFVLSPMHFDPHERTKLAPVLSELLKRDSVEKEGAVDEAVARYWFQTNPATGAPEPSATGADGLSPRQRRKQWRTALLAFFGVVTPVMIFLVFVIAQTANYCESLYENHRIVTANVTDIGVQRSKSNTVEYDADIDTVLSSSRFVLEVSYSVDGQQYTSTIRTSYRNQADTEALYYDSLDGYVELAYNPDQPDKVRPAVEVASQEATKLCESSGAR